MSGREAVLGAVRDALAATGSVTAARTPSSYRVRGRADAETRAALFAERVGDYRAEVHREKTDDVAATIAAACANRRVARLVIPSELPVQWRPSGPELVEDHAFDPHELDTFDGVLSGCTLAVAETGTIVLTGGPREGRRALTLVPDLHVCVVEEHQICEIVPEAFARLTPLVRDQHRPVTFISGPSATSDIELSRVEGVHGPRDLVVILAASRR